MRGSLRHLLRFALVFSFLRAYGQPFDLTGPKVDVHVKRGDVTLPVSEAANLLPGDRLWIHPDLPESQTTHFVLVVAFLRGSTNPPPPEWFTRVETWTRSAQDEGVFVTVPAGAQQALLFLAPATGGDFNTLRNTVRGRPGSFVRAAQDLQAASWERLRLEAYLRDVKVTSQYNPAALKKRAEMAARSLGIKIDESCFQKPPEQQVSCLSQNSEGMVLDDANAQSRVSQLTSGSTLDLMNQLSFTNVAGGGVYSPYVGAIVDTVKILSSLHTAHFQYIPALALPAADSLNLRLNMPPSFVNPKSVVVVALPPVGPSRPGPLHPADPSAEFCAAKPGLALPAEGAPLVYAAGMAHDLFLHIEPAGEKQKAIDLPVTADSARGGFAPTRPMPALPGGELSAEVRGKWGFDDWQGPRYALVAPQPGGWTLDASDGSALVVGRDDMLHIGGASTVCVRKIEGQSAGKPPIVLPWKSPKPNTLEVTAPMKDAEPGPFGVAIDQFGLDRPDRLFLVAYDAAASLDGLRLNAGDKTTLLKGTRLDEVAQARIGEIVLKPAHLRRAGNIDELQMTAGVSTASLVPGQPYVAHVDLKDGRVLKTPGTVDPPRPQIALLSKAVQSNDDTQPPPVQLGGADDLPVDGRLVFFLKSVEPAAFPRDEKIEVAASDGSFSATLSFADGSLILEDAHTAVAGLEPLKRFGPSAFGPVQVRAIAADGVAGDWQRLGTLVRLPGFTTLRCPRAAAKPCLLSGTNLFLADAFAATGDFSQPVAVSPEFAGAQLEVPHPVNGALYVKLRDDPATVQTLDLPVTPLHPEAARVAKAVAAPTTFASSTAPGVAPSSAQPAPAAPVTTTASPAPASAPVPTPTTTPSTAPSAAPATAPVAKPKAAPSAASGSAPTAAPANASAATKSAPASAPSVVSPPATEQNPQ